MTNKQTVHLTLTLSHELNARLDELARLNNISKSDILHKAIVLYDVVSEANAEHKRIGILDTNLKLVTEIVGI